MLHLRMAQPQSEWEGVKACDADEDFAAFAEAAGQGEAFGDVRDDGFFGSYLHR